MRMKDTEYECDHWVLGWDTVVDTSTELGRAQNDYITQDKSRTYKMTKEGFTLVRFHYEPGTQPFAGPKHDHRVRIDREPNFLVVGGDFRGNIAGDGQRHTESSQARECE